MLWPIPERNDAYPNAADTVLRTLRGSGSRIGMRPLAASDVRQAAHRLHRQRLVARRAFRRPIAAARGTFLYEQLRFAEVFTVDLAI
jgi:hypothetical protein